MKIKELYEADVGAALSDFAGGMGKVAQGAVGAVVDPLADIASARQKQKIDWINQFVRFVANELQAAHGYYQRSATKPAEKPSSTATEEPTRLTWGGEIWTKTNKGWVNSKNQPADAGTTKVLDMAVAKDTGPSTPFTESKLQQIYIKLITDEEFKQVVEGKGYDVNQTLAHIEKLFEDGAAGSTSPPGDTDSPGPAAATDSPGPTAAPAAAQPKNMFQYKSKEAPLNISDYIKTYILTRYLSPEKIRSLNTSIDQTLRTADRNYPNVAKELGALANIVYRYADKDRGFVSQVAKSFGGAQK